MMVYVACADSREIAVLTLDVSTGRLSAVDSIAVGGKVMPMAMSLDRRYLYAAVRSKPYAILTLAVDQGTGHLRPLFTSPVPADLAHISTDRTGRVLFGASYTGDAVLFGETRGGRLIINTLTVVTTDHPKAHAVVCDPSNRWLFVTLLGGDCIRCYRLSPVSGEVIPNEPALVRTPPGSGPRSLVIHPGGCLVYVTEQLSGAIGIFSLDPERGDLQWVGSARISPDHAGGTPSPADLRITPDGRFLYASERTSSTIAGWTIDAETGALERVGHTPTELQPRAFAIDPSGRYLIAAGQLSNALTSYVIDHRSGMLTPACRVATGRNPSWVEIVDLETIASDRTCGSA